jgi:hypothetical protein
MKKAFLIRTYYEKCTVGVFVAVGEDGNILMECSMLELPWLDNRQRESCIPEGIFKVIQRRTDKFKRHFHILDVPGRSYILQHTGNYTRQILGCQLPGDKLLHLNQDGITDIQNSRKTLDRMLALLGKEYELHVGSFGPPLHPHTISPSTNLPINQLPTA